MIRTVGATVALWTDYAAAGGTKLGDLRLIDGTLSADLSGEERLTATVVRQRWLDLGGDIGLVLRTTWPDGVTEHRIERVDAADGSPVVTLQALPVFAELATGGPIVRVVAGQPATRLAGEMAVATWLSTYITPHASATRIGVVVGTLERNPVLQLDLDAPTPAAVIQALFADAGLERELVRTSETVWTLNGRLAVGSTAAPIVVRPGVNQLALTTGVDRAEVATVVIPLGDADPETGDRATMAEVRYDVGGLPGSGWVILTDPESGVSPIQVDTQWVGARVELPDRTTRPILDSRASDGAVQLASTSGIATGMRIALVASDGTPLIEVYDSNGVAVRGRRVVPLSLSGVRGEANEIRNGRFANGVIDWNAANTQTPSAFAAIARTDLDVTFSGLVNGARSAGTGTGTPLAIDGLSPANRTIYRGDQLIIAGVTYTLTADAVPNTSGGITASITPTLAATYPDDTVVTIVRRERRTWLKSGTLTYSTWLTNGGLLAMKDSQSDGLLYRPMTGLTLTHDASGADFTGNIEGISYDSGFAGAFTVNTAGFIGTPPAQFADNDTFTATFVRETRAFRFSGTQTVGASSVTFKHISALARRDWQTGDTLFARRDFTATVRITGLTYMFPRDFTATIVTADSTLDDVAAVDRDGLAIVGVVGSWTITYGSDRVFTTVLPLRVVSISGTTMALVIADPTATSVEDNLPSLPQTANAAWTIVDSYAVTAGASWSNAGRATVSVSVPTGRTIARGQPLWANWIGGISGAETGTQTLLFAHAAVTGSASSIEVAGWDDYRSDWDGNTTLPTAVYRLFSGTGGSRFEFTGETMTAAATVQASGGAANVTLVAANGAALADNATFTVTRPPLRRPTDPTTGSVVRLLGPVATFGIGGGTPGLQSSTATIVVPSGHTVQVTAFATVALSAGTYDTGNQPVLAIVDSLGALLAWGRAADTTVQAAQSPTIVRLIVQHTLTATRTLGVRLIGGSTNGALWHVVLDAMLSVTTRDDVPWIGSSWGNQLAQRCIDVLRARRNPVAAVEVDLATLRRWSDAPDSTAPVVLGQTVSVPAYGLTRRVTALERSLLNPDAVRLTVGTVPTDLSRRVAAALAGGSS